jgi:small subunit ribosomal protein S16
MRLTRVGSKKNPIYRVVVADSRSPRDGKFIEIVGRYNPQTDPSLIEFDEAKVKDWLSKGAQPSEKVPAVAEHLGPRRRCLGEGGAEGTDRDENIV